VSIRRGAGGERRATGTLGVAESFAAVPPARLAATGHQYREAIVGTAVAAACAAADVSGGPPDRRPPPARASRP
jgi:hypothetical protein